MALIVGVMLIDWGSLLLTHLNEGACCSCHCEGWCEDTQQHLLELKRLWIAAADAAAADDDDDDADDDDDDAASFFSDQGEQSLKSL